MSNRVVHFEIHCPDLQAGMKFYESMFGWKLTKWGGPDEYILIDTGDASQPGINGGMMKSRDGNPRTVNTVYVPDVDAAVTKVISLGGKNVVPKMAIPSVGWLVYCTDPGGNIFGMMTPDASAK